jgi:hypothetical protein
MSSANNIEEIIHAYSRVMEETTGVSFYDTNLLPYPKDEIAAALLTAIKLTDDVQQKEVLKVGLIHLACFQAGIGEEPLELMPNLSKMQEISDTAQLELLATHSTEKYNLMLDKVKLEENTYLQMAEKVLSGDQIKAVPMLVAIDISHVDFIKKWKNGEINIHVNKSGAIKAVEAGYLPTGYRGAQTLYGWIWITGLIVALPLMIWYKWWVGLIVGAISMSLPEALKKTAAQGIIDKALEDEQFYKLVIQHGIVRVSKK